MFEVLAVLIMPLVVLAGVLYLLPTVVAVARGHRRLLGVALINILLGWTLLGWLLALAWACLGGRGRRRR
jgi:hypothetical protein